MPQIWRLIPLLQASGQKQMALDAWLLDQHCRGEHPPVLRFYTWSPPAISLGYHQRHWPEHWHQLIWQDHPVELIRRPTGGRAVLHQGDLTYAVVMSELPVQRLQAYQRICEFLIQGWRSLGVDLDYGNAKGGHLHNPNCFGTATGADLVLTNGAKLIGSAQVWRKGAVLQHGSIRLDPNPGLFTQVFGSDAGFAPSPRLCLPKASLMESVIAALTSAARDCFQAQFVAQPLSALEWQAVEAYSAVASVDC